MPEKIPGWITEMGGWGVVLLIVRWMMLRIDKLIAASEVQTRLMLEEFRSWRAQEAEQHNALEETQKEILQRLPGRRR